MLFIRIFDFNFGVFFLLGGGGGGGGGELIFLGVGRGVAVF